MYTFLQTGALATLALGPGFTSRLLLLFVFLKSSRPSAGQCGREKWFWSLLATWVDHPATGQKKQPQSRAALTQHLRSTVSLRSTWFHRREDLNLRIVNSIPTFTHIETQNFLAKTHPIHASVGLSGLYMGHCKCKLKQRKLSATYVPNKSCILTCCPTDPVLLRTHTVCLIQMSSWNEQVFQRPTLHQLQHRSKDATRGSWPRY